MYYGFRVFLYFFMPVFNSSTPLRILKTNSYSVPYRTLVHRLDFKQPHKAEALGQNFSKYWAENLFAVNVYDILLEYALQQKDKIQNSYHWNYFVRTSHMPFHSELNSLQNLFKSFIST